MDSSGKPGIVALAPQIEGIENVSFNDFTIGVDITGAAQANNTYQWSDNFSKVTGKHMFKFGASVHLDQVNINPECHVQRLFPFSGHRDRIGFRGLPARYRQQLRPGRLARRFYLRNDTPACIAQDSWQRSAQSDAQLRLALGPAAAMAREIQPVADAGSADSSRWSIPARPPGWSSPATRGIPDTLAPAGHTNFAPRVGLAYAPGAKTSVRASYGALLHRHRRPVGGHHERQSALRLRLRQLRAAAVSTPFITAASGQDVGQRFPEPIPTTGASATNPNASRRLVAVPADHRRAFVLPSAT